MPVLFLDGYHESAIFVTRPKLPDSDDMGQNSDDMGQILAVKAHFETASPEERRRTCAMCMETFDSRNQLFEHLATCGGTCGTIQSRKAAQTTPSVLTMSDHPHELHYSQSLRHHCCDLCDTDIKKPHDGYRCSDGCDFDVCMKCAKAYIKEDMKEAAKQSPPGRVLQALAWLLKQLIDDPSSVSREHINNALNHVEPSNPRPVQASLLSSSQLPYGSRVQVQSTCAFNGKLGRILSVAPYTVREWRTESLSKHHFRHDAMGRVVVEDGVARMCAGGFVRWRSLKPLFDAAMSTPDNEAKHHFRHDAMGRVVVEDGVARMCASGLIESKVEVLKEDAERVQEDCMRFDFETCWRDWKSSGFRCRASSTGRREAVTYMCELVVDGKIEVSPIKASHLSLLPGKPSNSSLPHLAPESHREPAQQDDEDADAFAGQGVKKDSPWQVGTLVRLLDDTTDSNSHLAPGRGARSIGCIASVDLHHNKVSVYVCTDRALSECSHVKIGDKVRLVTGYAAVYDAIQGPMVPGQIASVKALQDGLVLVESVGEGGVNAKWWYQPEALVLASASVSKEDSSNAVCFDSIKDAGACNNGECVCACVCAVCVHVFVFSDL